jgi:hypothetical protein
MMRWMRHVAHMGEMRKLYKFLLGKLEAKRLLRKLTCRWKDNIKYHHKERGWQNVDCSYVAQDKDM